MAALLLLTSCQGRLRVQIYNNSNEPLVLVTPNKSYPLPVHTHIIIDSPKDMAFTVRWGEQEYSYEFPYGPRPHTVNNYIDYNLVAKIQITPTYDMVIVPTNEPIIAVISEFSGNILILKRNDNRIEQAGPGYPPQGVGSPDP